MQTAPAPKWLTPVGVIGLLWNLLGCWAWISDLRITPEQLAALGPEMQRMHAAMPVWAPATTGVAVLGGTLGCLGLILRQRWARTLLWLSLLGVILQDIGMFVLAGGASLAGSAAIMLQAVVLVVAIVLALLGRRGTREGWLR
jgi:hypothetical protein